MDRDESDWREAEFSRVAADDNVRARARSLANQLREQDDPVVTSMDVTAARPYLRACMQRMSMAEISEISHEELAHLLARGALGQARYRSGRVGGERGSRPRK